MDIMDTAIGGMKTRFIHKGKNPTLMILASSKRTEKSFLEEHMKKKLADEGETKNTLIVDEPVWNIKPSDTYSGKRFNVALGNKFLQSEIIPENADLNAYRNRGFKILDVPVEFRSEFLDDIDRALCDYAGISSSELSKYINGPRLSETKSSDYQNPFINDVLEIGNAPDDTNQYYDFFDLERVVQKYKSYPLFIHLDMSISGDKTGIAGVWITEKRPGINNDARELCFRLAFSVSIKAPKGYQVSFAKNREFVYWLKEQGFRICGITTDTYQNASTGQDFIAKGFNYETLSVDRVNNDRICVPYAYLKNAIYEGRVVIYEDCPLLTEELLGLERNNNTGRIDHPDSGRYGCFSGDTKVSLVDGRNLSFLELVDEFNSGKINYVYSFNESEKIIEPKPIVKAWCTRKNAELMTVELDNGELIRCTPSHKFMLRTGTYIEAKDLIPGDSLMPLYTKVSGKGLKGYRMYYEPIEDKWHYEHRKFAKEIFDKKYLVHHKDCNPLNNSPDNLIWMSKSAHNLEHARMQTGAQSEEAKAKRGASLSYYYDNNKDNPVFLERNRKIGETLHNKVPQEEWERREQEKEQRKSKREYRAQQAEKKRRDKLDKIRAIEEMFDISWESLSTSERDSYAVKYSRAIDPSIQENISSKVSKNHSLGKYDNAYTALKSYNEKSKRLKELCPTIDEDKFFEIFGFNYSSLNRSQKGVYSRRYREIVCKDILNHKVIGVYYSDEKEDVYDLEILDNHNFALASGVFVHNSKDQADCLAGAIYNASKHGEEFNFEYGETLDAMVDVSNEMSYDNTKAQMVIDFEEELKKVSMDFSSSLNVNNNKNTNPLSSYGFGYDIRVDDLAIMDGIIL